MSDPHATPTGTTPGAHEAKHDVLGEIDAPSTLYVVYLVVLGLALLNIGLSVTGLGSMTQLVQLLIGSVQAAVVAYYFMHLKQGDRVVILAALASVFWVGILFVLFMADYMSRQYVVGG
jgi:cytochrome c oxidase subunit 4